MNKVMSPETTSSVETAPPPEALAPEKAAMSETEAATGAQAALDNAERTVAGFVKEDGTRIAVTPIRQLAENAKGSLRQAHATFKDGLARVLGVNYNVEADNISEELATTALAVNRTKITEDSTGTIIVGHKELNLGDPKVKERLLAEQQAQDQHAQPLIPSQKSQAATSMRPEMPDGSSEGTARPEQITLQGYLEFMGDNAPDYRKETPYTYEQESKEQSLARLTALDKLGEGQLWAHRKTMEKTLAQRRKDLELKTTVANELGTNENANLEAKNATKAVNLLERELALLEQVEAEKQKSLT